MYENITIKHWYHKITIHVSPGAGIACWSRTQNTWMVWLLYSGWSYWLFWLLSRRTYRSGKDLKIFIIFIFILDQTFLWLLIFGTFKSGNLYAKLNSIVNYELRPIFEFDIVRRIQHYHHPPIINSFLHSWMLSNDNFSSFCLVQD